MNATRPRFFLPLVLLILWSVGGICGIAAEADPKIDRLEAPVPGYEKYRTLFKGRLFVSPADCGRLDIDGQDVVAVYATKGDDSMLKYKITNTVANVSLIEPGAAQSARTRITRRDADIPATAALAVQRAWVAMLQRPYARFSRENPGPLVLDGIYAEFSLIRSGKRAMYGVLPASGAAKYRGPHVEALWRLGQSLIKYCSTPQNQRIKMAKAIEREAENLAASVAKER